MGHAEQVRPTEALTWNPSHSKDLLPKTWCQTPYENQKMSCVHFFWHIQQMLDRIWTSRSWRPRRCLVKNRKMDIPEQFLWCAIAHCPARGVMRCELGLKWSLGGYNSQLMATVVECSFLLPSRRIQTAPSTSNDSRQNIFPRSKSDQKSVGNRVQSMEAPSRNPQD